MPDTPQRIATDTSQKLDVRYGGTMAAYGAQAADLTFIPLAVAVRFCRRRCRLLLPTPLSSPNLHGWLNVGLATLCLRRGDCN